jgi:hypothetical protein
MLGKILTVSSKSLGEHRIARPPHTLHLIIRRKEIKTVSLLSYALQFIIWKSFGFSTHQGENKGNGAIWAIGLRV